MNILAISTLDNEVEDEVIEAYAKENYPGKRFIWIEDKDTGYAFYTWDDPMIAGNSDVEHTIDEYARQYTIFDTVNLIGIEDYPYKGGWYAVYSSEENYTFGNPHTGIGRNHTIQVIAISGQ